MLHVWVRSRGYCYGLECSVWHHCCFNGFDVSRVYLWLAQPQHDEMPMHRRTDCLPETANSMQHRTHQRTHSPFFSPLQHSWSADLRLTRQWNPLEGTVLVSAPSWDRVGMDTQKGRIARIWGTHGHHKWSRNKTWPCEQRVPQGLVMQIGCDRDNIHSREWFLNRYNKNILAKVVASKKQNWYIKGNLWKSPFLVGTWRIISLAKWLPWFINLTGTSIPYPPKRKSPSGNLT